jgi:hypothetical protein
MLTRNSEQPDTETTAEPPSPPAREKGPLDGTFTADFESETFLNGEGDGKAPPGERETWVIQSSCPEKKMCGARNAGQWAHGAYGPRQCCRDGADVPTDPTLHGSHRHLESFSGASIRPAVVDHATGQAQTTGF